MCYRQTSHYLVLCDRCGLTAPEGPGWSTPSTADEAALEAGWEMTMTEHLCPDCALAATTDEPGDDLLDPTAVSTPGERPALTPGSGQGGRGFAGQEQRTTIAVEASRIGGR
jgi:hypothetical protein